MTHKPLKDKQHIEDTEQNGPEQKADTSLDQYAVAAGPVLR